MKQLILDKNTLNNYENNCDSFFEDIEEIYIDEDITDVDPNLFSKCPSLKKVVFSDSSSIDSIPDFTFANCEQLEEIVLPIYLTDIGMGAFVGCKSLKTIHMPDKLEYIGPSAFAYCESLEFIHLPDSLRGLSYNLFLNCKNLTDVTLPKNTTALEDGLFSGCTKLNIQLNPKIKSIGTETFKACQSLTNFPSHIISFGRGAFKGCTSLEVVELNEFTSFLPDELFEECTHLKNIFCAVNRRITIGKSCFQNCSSLEKIPNFIQNFSASSFEGCNSIREIDLSEFTNLLHPTIEKGCFKNCKQLTKFSMNNGKIKKIEKSVFENCISLQKIHLKGELGVISPRAFANCESLEELNLGSFVKQIGEDAFLNTFSLKNIHVDKSNSSFVSYQEKALISKVNSSLILYAGGCLDDAFSLMDYCLYTDKDNQETINPLYTIENYAFSGAKHLKELIIPTSVTSFMPKCFTDCSIQKLTVKNLPLFNGFSTTTRFDLKEAYLPFKEVIFDDDIPIIQFTNDIIFTQLEKITFPKKMNILSGFQSTNCNNLKNIFISEDCKSINNIKLSDKGTIQFANGLQFNNSDFISFNYIDNYETYETKNGFLVGNASHYYSIDKKYIKNNFMHSDLILDSPTLILNYVKLLHSLNQKDSYLKNGVFMKAFSTELMQIFINNVEKNREDKEKYKLFIPKKAKEKYLEEININPNEEGTKSLFRNFVEEIQNCDFSMELHSDDDFSLKAKRFLKLQQDDAFQFIRFFDKNMKRMIRLSGVLENENTAGNNFQDLMKLVNVLGGFDEDSVVRQRAITFINDNILTENKKIDNSYKYVTVGDDIHRRYNEIQPSDTFNYEFVRFFMENYYKLCDLESIKPGMIARIYNLFPSILKSSTSNKGAQRQLLVTFEKALDYLNTSKFENVDSSNRDLAKFIGMWYDENEDFVNALLIMEEAKTAPRNIFSKMQFDKNQNIVFKEEKDSDLKEEVKDGFCYEWLPKQDMHNLVLGKYCNCCAHLRGAGAGIMRASMVSIDHQNLVIRNKMGEIIAKATLYLNREQGYGVFNTMEINSNYRDNENCLQIYEAFMRGSDAFYQKYNQNNPTLPLQKITIGAGRNVLQTMFNDKEKHPSSNVLTAPSYKNWKFDSYGTYAGDSSYQQILVLKRK